MQSIINPDWDFSKIGVGGIDREFDEIFKRAFGPRVYPPEIVQLFGLFLVFMCWCLRRNTLTISFLQV